MGAPPGSVTTTASVAVPPLPADLPRCACASAVAGRMNVAASRSGVILIPSSMARPQPEVKQEPTVEIRGHYQMMRNLNLTSSGAASRVKRSMKSRHTAFGARSGNARPVVCTTPLLGILIRSILLPRSTAAG